MRVRDDDVAVLASVPMALKFETPIDVAVRVAGTELTAEIDGNRLQAHDDSPLAFRDGGIGLFIADGALSTDAVSVAPP